MRYSPDHKERSRERILHEASVLLRERGVDGVGLAEIMRHAGLTHGGFYAHFPSRDVLVEEALSSALEESIGRLQDIAAAAPPGRKLAATVRAYLHPLHLDKPGDGCVFAALGNDVARLSDAAKTALDRHRQRLTNLLAEGLADAGRPVESAPVVLATLVGALTLGRLQPDRAGAEALLRQTATSILS